MDGFSESRRLQNMSEDGTTSAKKKKKRARVWNGEKVIMSIFCLHFYPLSDHLSIRCHRSSIHSCPVAFVAQDLYSSSKTNHSSCTCKQLSYFHFCSSSNPVGQTTASDQKHTCKLTFAEAHSGNKSPTFLWFLSLKPKHRGFILCFFSSLYM